jgi:WD40 repeat protein
MQQLLSKHTFAAHLLSAAPRASHPCRAEHVSQCLRTGYRNLICQKHKLHPYHRFRNTLTPDPFAQKYPDTVESTLSSQASSIKFNSNGPYAGQYLAAGGADGLVEVWDVETRGVVRVLEGHVKAVGCVR